MGIFTRFRRGMRKSISSLSSSHSPSTTTSSASPPSSPPTTHLAAPVPAPTPAPPPTTAPEPAPEPHKEPKMLSWSNSDKPTTSTSATNASATKWTSLMPKKKKQSNSDDARMRSRREHQEMLERFTISFGTRRRSQLVPGDHNDAEHNGGAISPRTSTAGSLEDGFMRRAAEIEQH